MALQKNIAGTTQVIYALIQNLQYMKPSGTPGRAHMVYVEMQIKDTADPTMCVTENRLEYQIPIDVIVNPDPLIAPVINDPLDIHGSNTNMVAQAYTWLKANVVLFADFTSV